MNFHHYPLVALLAVSSTASLAQGYKIYDFEDCLFETTDQDGNTGMSMMFGAFNHVSANGKYAVGTDDMLSFRSFLWCADNPTEIEVFGEYTSEIAIYDVTNDGTLIGGIRDAEGVMYPAYKPMGANWQMLTRGMEELNYEMAIDDYVNMALRAATPDGRYMAGSFYINTGEYSDTGWPVSNLVPVLWKDGKLERIYDDMGIKEFMVWDISDDGSIICGMNTAGIGGHNPAFIRNGELIELFDCGDERTYDTPDDVYGNTEGGLCNSVDNQGNIYGYFVEPVDEMSAVMNYFVVPADCDYAVFLADDYSNDAFPDDYWMDDWYICGGNGMGFTKDHGHLYSLLDCSDNGQVFVGGGVFNLGFGMANVPQVCVYDEPLAPSPVKLDKVTEAVNTKGVTFNGRSVIVKGVYQEATVYDAKGALIAKAGQGQPIALPDAKGVFMVSVAYADGMHTYKVSK